MKTEILSIVGMTDEGCLDKVTAILHGIAGVSDASVSLYNSQATVTFDQEQTSIQELQASIGRAGYRAAAVKASSDCCGGCGG